ncbi:MAG TPA: peptidylprolyl isomerase, partial [Verrucomicrobiae bacterium]|nr:peptidylprolyl isomerase [Verrucomicrobiae bacterium]
MADKNPVVLMSTSKGNIRIELDAEKAPISTKNFLDY